MKTTAFHNKKKTAIIVSVIALALLVVAVIVFVNVSKSQKYSAALDAENAGKYANLYRYDATQGKLVCVGSFQIVANGQAAFDFPCGGDYFVTVTAGPAMTATAATTTTTGTYVVQSGDYLYGIARKFHMTLHDLLAANPQISNPNTIYPGQTLHVSK